MFVPAKENMLAKLGTFGADIYIIDIEDSILPDDKATALIHTVEKLTAFGDLSKLIVRINSDNAEKELNLLSTFPEIGLMLPKFGSVCQYNEFEEILRKHYVIALVETPLGIVNIKEIASCEWVDGIAFGAEDYTAKANMENNDTYLNFAKSCIVTYSKAYGKRAFDTPSFKLNERKLFENEVRNSVAMGFNGKLLISPKHVAYINEQFENGDIEHMKGIIKQYEEKGEAVVIIDEKVFEKMHIDRMKKVIKENGGL